MSDDNNRKISELTIMEVVERMLQFSENREFIDASDYPERYNRGISDALSDMRRDMDCLTEAEFTAKYEEALLTKGDELREENDEDDGDDEPFSYLEGYCSTVEDILNMIHPSKLYDEMTMLREGIFPDDEIDDAFLDEIFS